MTASRSCGRATRTARCHALSLTRSPVLFEDRPLVCLRPGQVSAVRRFDDRALEPGAAPRPQPRLHGRRYPRSDAHERALLNDAFEQALALQQRDVEEPLVVDA